MDPSTGLNLALCLLDSFLCCWQRSALQVPVPACAGGKPGSLAPGALSDMGEAAFCASTHHKRWPQAALAGCPLSLPVQVPGQAQAQARTPSTPPVYPQSSISKMPHLLSLSLTFSYISPRPPGSFRVSSSFFLLQAASSSKLLGTSSPLNISDT